MFADRVRFVPGLAQSCRVALARAPFVNGGPHARTTTRRPAPLPPHRRPARADPPQPPDSTPQLLGSADGRGATGLVLSALSVISGASAATAATGNPQTITFTCRVSRSSSASRRA